jgi:hypothetical protein
MKNRLVNENSDKVMLKAQQEISYNFVMLFLSELFSQKIILEN